MIIFYGIHAINFTDARLQRFSILNSCYIDFKVEPQNI